MKYLIINGKISKDLWQFLPDSELEFDAPNQVMKAAVFLENEIEEPKFDFGLVLQNTGDFDKLRAFIAKAKNLKLLVCQFESFKNGFFYSIARILREELGFKGQIRASGVVYYDQLEYLVRSGFDAFDFAEFSNEAKFNQALKWFESETIKNGKPHYLDEYTKGLYALPSKSRP